MIEQLAIATEVVAAIIGAVTAVVLEAVRVAGDRWARRTGRRRTRRSDVDRPAPFDDA